MTPHAVYQDLVDRGTVAYQELFEEALTHRELLDIRRGTSSGLGVGRADFLLRVAKLLG